MQTFLLLCFLPMICLAQTDINSRAQAADKALAERVREFKQPEFVQPVLQPRILVLPQPQNLPTFTAPPAAGFGMPGSTQQQGNKK